MLSEIGSNFWIAPEDLKQSSSGDIDFTQFGCEGSDYAWFSTGRSAISFVLDTIELRNPSVKKVAILPPFTCHTVIEPFLEKGYEIHTYHIGRDLSSSAYDVLEISESFKAGLVLFHKFFGSDTIKDMDTIIPVLREHGIVIIEDCTQCLYSGFKKTDSDYFVGSIRKWCGVPDGGFAVCREGIFTDKPILIDKNLQDAKIESSILKYEYLFEGKGEKSVFLNRYREAEDILDAQNSYFTISDVSKVIQSKMDVKQLKFKRRENFAIIAKGLANTKGVGVIFSALANNEVPLYCPILCDDRQIVQKELVENSIFAPVVWPKAACCPIVDEEVDYIYNHILCIPIDQRYGVDDMERVVSVIKSIK